jgi:hypothetical protein
MLWCCVLLLLFVRLFFARSSMVSYSFVFYFQGHSEYIGIGPDGFDVNLFVSL